LSGEQYDIGGRISFKDLFENVHSAAVRHYEVNEHQLRALFRDEL
jgi:hypothetical protein